MQKSDHDVRHVAERQFTSLIPSGTGSWSSALTQDASHLQRVKQERLHAVVDVVRVVVEDGGKIKSKCKKNADGTVGRGGGGNGGGGWMASVKLLTRFLDFP